MDSQTDSHKIQADRQADIGQIKADRQTVTKSNI